MARSLGPLRAYVHAHKGQTLDWLTMENVRIQMRNVKAMLLSLERAEVEVKGFLYDIEKRELEGFLKLYARASLRRLRLRVSGEGGT